VQPLVTSILVSACLGALVGLIRQWSDQAAKPGGDADLGGLRTYTLLAVLGCVGAFLSSNYSVAVLPVVLAVVALHLTSMQLRGVTAGSQPGSTSLASSLLTCLLGALVQWGHLQPAVVVAALTAVFVGIKQPVHAWTRLLTPEDIRGTLQFVAITGVILPLVPDRTYGLFDAFNPYSTWLMVVLISGLGFAGYLMMRFLGAQAGITITGLAGGLASSTATTLAFSRRSKDEPELSASYATAVVLACTVMLPRVLFVVGVVHRELAVSLIAPFALMAVPGLLFTLWMWFARRPVEGTTVATPKLSNPLSLVIAIKFALIYAAIAFLVKAATQLDWHGSLLPLSFVSGLTDLDAISLSMAGSLNGSVVTPALAVKAVMLGAIANTLMKGGLAVTFGSPALRRQVAFVLGLTVLCGVAGFWLVR
jgi:uncharacterized membrane protein (DUF4010 family)